jgi:8-oxo-dGTP diphosphatase
LFRGNDDYRKNFTSKSFLYFCSTFILKMMEAVVVTCAVIRSGKNILAVQRSRSMSQAGKWEFPGGKLEEGETTEQCIIREIREELGIEIRIDGTLKENIHDYGNFIIRLVPFLATHVSGEIRLIEHRAYDLIDKTMLMTLDWAQADIPVAMQAAETD